jgi:hypothetical protein
MSYEVKFADERSAVKGIAQYLGFRRALYMFRTLKSKPAKTAEALLGIIGVGGYPVSAFASRYGLS